MPPPGLPRLRPLHKLISSSYACPQPQSAVSSPPLPDINFHQLRPLSLPHEPQEARLGLFSRSGDAFRVFGAHSFGRTFSVSRMELEKLSGAGMADAIGGEYVELENAQEAVGLRAGDVAIEDEVSLEMVEEEETMLSSSSDEESLSCEGVEEGFLEGAKALSDPEGRSYLHVLSVEEVQMILEKTRADDVQVIPVRDVCEWADNLVVASGHSGRHLRGIADAICFEVKKRSTNVDDNVYPTVEGRESEEWMVVDCGSIVVHVFRDDIRGEYNLEELWRKRRPVNIKDIGM